MFIKGKHVGHIQLACQAQQDAIRVRPFLVIVLLENGPRLPLAIYSQWGPDVRLVLRLGQLLAFAILLLVSLTPLLEVRAWLSVIGLGLYVAGTAMVLISIHYFGLAPDAQPGVEGPYRFSRNPQWVGLFSVLLGLAVSCGSWLLMLAVFVVGAIYHIQIVEEERACRAKYGRPYEEYLRSVPRYLLVK